MGRGTGVERIVPLHRGRRKAFGKQIRGNVGDFFGGRQGVGQAPSGRRGVGG